MSCRTIRLQSLSLFGGLRNPVNGWFKGKPRKTNHVGGFLCLMHALFSGSKHEGSEQPAESSRYPSKPPVALMVILPRVLHLRRIDESPLNIRLLFAKRSPPDGFLSVFPKKTIQGVQSHCLPYTRFTIAHPKSPKRGR